MVMNTARLLAKLFVGGFVALLTGYGLSLAGTKLVTFLTGSSVSGYAAPLFLFIAISTAYVAFKMRPGEEGFEDAAASLGVIALAMTVEQLLVNHTSLYASGGLLEGMSFAVTGLSVLPSGPVTQLTGILLLVSYAIFGIGVSGRVLRRIPMLNK